MAVMYIVHPDLRPIRVVDDMSMDFEGDFFYSFSSAITRFAELRQAKIDELESVTEKQAAAINSRQPVDGILRHDFEVIDQLFALRGVDRFYVGDVVNCFYFDKPCQTEVLDIFVDADTSSGISVLCRLPEAWDTPAEYDLGWFKNPESEAAIADSPEVGGS